MSTHPHRRSRLAPSLVALTIAGATVALLAGPAAARSPRPRPARTTAPAAASSDATTVTEPRTITVVGTARVRGTPDVLTMTLGVSSRGQTVGEALERNND